MSLLRATARSMLSAIFIYRGVKTLRRPETSTEEAQLVNKRVTPLVSRVAPEQIAAYIPKDTGSWTRALGVAQVAGGLALATGMGRRLGAFALTLANIPHLVSTAPGNRKVEGDFLTELALTGAVALAAQDTQGRPSAAYRAQLAGQRAERGSKRAVRRVRREANALTSDAQKTAQRARKQAQKAGKQARGALTR